MLVIEVPFRMRTTQALFSAMAGMPGRSLQSPRGDVAVHMVGNRRLLTQVNAVRVHVDGNGNLTMTSRHISSW